MTQATTYGRRAFAALLCLCLTAWSVMPAATHAPTAFDTTRHHLETIADHGHAHGAADVLYWAMHGHSHDLADHDHGQALPGLGERGHRTAGNRDMRRPNAAPGGDHHGFRIDRPPRA